MAGNVAAEVLACYRERPPEMAADVSPARTLRELIRRLSRRWISRFDEAAPDLAAYFAQRVSKRSDANLKAILKKSGISVAFKATAAQNDVMQSIVGENVSLIRSIAQEHLTQVEGLVMRSVQKGGDMGELRVELQARYGITKRRASLIARDQNHKATAALNRVRQEELGITEAIWLHSHGGRHPRPEHLAFDGHRYEVSKGAFLEGKWTWPGVEINCRCVSRSILPGL